MSRTPVVVLCGLMAACGSSPPSTPSTPSPPPVSTPAAPPPPVISEFSGTVTATNGGQRLPGISIAASTSSVSTDDNGAFLFRFSGSETSTGSFPVALTGTGIMTHTTRLQWPAHAGIALDAITLAAPFDLTFYRQFARGAFDKDVIYALFPWTTNPSIYIRTIDIDGRSIEPEVLSLVTDWSRRSVPMWTAGKLQVDRIETGPEDRPDTPGWIVVDFIRDMGTNLCGYSFVGRDPGRITLNDDRCNCGSVKVPPGVVLHEFGHALGFFHVPDRQSVMYPQIAGGCPLPVLSAPEQYHSAIVYNRPRGNTDPDDDPTTASHLTPLQVRQP